MASESGYRPRLRRQGKRLTVWLVAALLVAATVALVFLSTPYQAQPESIDAVEADDGVTLTETDQGYVIEPAAGSSDVGVVFYPGARVSPGAYVGSLADLTRQANATIVVPRLPLNLAVVDYGIGQTPVGSHAADRAMSRHPAVEEWYVGGHSLGGAMACRYAHSNREVTGLLLYASYCDVDISERSLAVVSVAGEADTVIDRDAYERGLRNLPETATTAELPGVNHSQFGTYRGQDEPSGTSYETAHRRLNEVVVPWLQNQTADRSRVTSPSG
ncbi:alpha/beta hydrolase [Halovenus sp. HT40]|uniref:alpha/beta hydrolase n=1 Tax=Halovenus sp. HT40 TaxID=3126691 RepID=UPI00300EC7E6